MGEKLTTYFFGALGVAIIVGNGGSVSMIITSLSEGARAVSSALIAGGRERSGIRATVGPVYAVS